MKNHLERGLLKAGGKVRMVRIIINQVIVPHGRREVGMTKTRVFHVEWRCGVTVTKSDKSMGGVL